jgi:hypothetical protein
MIICSTVMLVGFLPPHPGGFQGRAYEREPDGGIGPTIPGVEIIFLKEDGSTSRRVTTDDAGLYRVSLGKGRYWVTATHPDYEDYASAPGFFVVTEEGYQTGNVFLREPRVTTVLLVRHAERGNDHLTHEGEERRDKLAEVARKAGVTAIYATSATRTQQTVQSLAELWKTDVITEDNAVTLVNDRILAEHRGDVVLVASHSGGFGYGGSFSTVPNVIEALGASGCHGAVHEYDNLYVVSRAVDDASETNVVNLQYGRGDEPVPPDSVVCMNHMITILLVPHAELGDPGESRGNELAHVVRKAGVTGIYGPSPAREPVKSLASELGLQVSPYSPDDVPGLVGKVLSDHAGEAVVVAGDKSAMSEMIRELGGSPYPPIFPNERDSLFVLTLLEPGDTRVLSLQYGEPSP